MRARAGRGRARWGRSGSGVFPSRVRGVGALRWDDGGMERRVRFETVSGAVYLLRLNPDGGGEVIRLPGESVSRHYDSRRGRAFEAIEQLSVGAPVLLRTGQQSWTGKPYNMSSTEVVALVEDPAEWPWDAWANTMPAPEDADRAAVRAAERRVRILVETAQQAAAAMAPAEHPVVVEVTRGGDTLHLTVDFGHTPLQDRGSEPLRRCEADFEPWVCAVVPWLHRRVADVAVTYVFAT